MSKHTPGPWRLVATNQGPTIAGASPGYLATTRGPFALKPVTEEEANARLIAAAPDLLNALQGLLNWGREHTSPLDPNSPHDLLVDACEAIAIATGENHMAGMQE